ncbi:60S ribosomal protein L27A [Irineochytrium annulatum]|nr:60S ribosomal protein L27A [Irineochytrium annulatum]
MAPTRLHKNRKSRGHVSCGHGRVGKHRKHPGGRGLAGGQHHHRINMDKYHPGYFGKVGMRQFHVTKNQYFCKTINLDRIWTLVPVKDRKAAEKNPSGAVPVVDLTRSGTTKLLGKGKLPKIPFIVKTRLISRKAELKIVAAGGKVELARAPPSRLANEMRGDDSDDDIPLAQSAALPPSGVGEPAAVAEADAASASGLPNHLSAAVDNLFRMVEQRVVPTIPKPSATAQPPTPGGPRDRSSWTSTAIHSEVSRLYRFGENDPETPMPTGVGYQEPGYGAPGFGSLGRRKSWSGALADGRSRSLKRNKSRGRSRGLDKVEEDEDERKRARMALIMFFAGSHAIHVPVVY